MESKMKLRKSSDKTMHSRFFFSNVISMFPADLATVTKRIWRKKKSRGGGRRIVLQTGRTGIEMNAKLDTFCVVFVLFFFC